MKKFLVLCLTFLFCAPTNALVIDTRKDGSAQKAIREIGFRILNANNITHNMMFYLKTKTKAPNACAYWSNGVIAINDETFKYVDDIEELAGILAHEISHQVDYRQGALKGYFSYISTGLAPKKYETKADLRAVDYMVKAGYNPVSYIVALNKIAPQDRYDWHQSHPLTTKRMMTVYEYIYTKYPEYLVDNKYKNDVYYQNFLLTSKENRQKFQEKLKSGSKKKIKYQ